MLLLIDNYDSFTYNLFQYLSELGEDVEVVRNDKATVQELNDMGPERLVVSPGPSHPRNAGISIEAIQHFAGKIPVLGVCLGHQAIGEAFGGIVDHAGELETRQDLNDRTRRQRRLQRPTQPLRSSPLPLASRPTRRGTTGLRSLRTIRRKRRHHGHEAPGNAHRRRPIPPRVDLDAAGEGFVAKLFGDERANNIEYM